MVQMTAAVALLRTVDKKLVRDLLTEIAHPAKRLGGARVHFVGGHSLDLAHCYQERYDVHDVRPFQIPELAYMCRSDFGRRTHYQFDLRETNTYQLSAPWENRQLCENMDASTRHQPNQVWYVARFSRHYRALRRVRSRSVEFPLVSSSLLSKSGQAH